MEQSTIEPLTVEEAKARLRFVARGTGPSAWAARHPYLTLALGLGTGMLLGSSISLRGILAGLPRWLLPIAKVYIK